MKNIKKITAVIMIAIIAFTITFVFTGCTEADRISYNVSREADNFNVIRRVTVINNRTDKLLLEVTGNLSLDNNTSNELEIICKTGENEYKKHFVRLNEYTSYVVEDLCGADVSPYHYEIIYQPEMIVPFEIKKGN